VDAKYSVQPVQPPLFREINSKCFLSRLRRIQIAHYHNTEMAEGHGAGCGVAELIVFILALIFGTACSLTSKVLMSMHSIGLTGKMELFTNPLFQTCTMFVGMLFSLPIHMLVLKFKIPFYGYAHLDESRGKYVAITGEDAEKPKEIGWNIYFALFFPAMFDLMATACCMFGLRYVNVSIYQMLRGGSIIFVALLKHFALKDKLQRFMWIGVAWNVVSICIVGYVAMLNSEAVENEHVLNAAAAASSFAKDVHDSSSSHYAAGHYHGSHDSATVGKAHITVVSTGEDYSDDMNHPLYGILLILGGAVVQSVQYAWEEKVMSMDVGAPPLLLIGMEGFWGTLVCLTVMYPLAYYTPGPDHGSVENPWNTLELLKNSEDVQNVFWLYFFAVFGYNMLCALITFMLNSVWHAILDNFRPITVWSCDLFIYYFVTASLGERWTVHSYLQVIAMFILLYGTAIYNAPNAGSIKLTGGIPSLCMDCTDEYRGMEGESAALTGAAGAAPPMSPHFSTMSPFRSQALGQSPALARKNSLMKETKAYGTDLEMMKARKASFA